ncbi:hypothetical protein EW145_g8546 [Phellinidium pouzarii]|uniref:Uncharacterized protein n=1 Tax=Phellinidium pouzarii TaxID=167371 RepID=A0A4S4K681_9AGAM|nr:hypothetical protein EW145_g8546 [Phellinidium pouzarii]
MSRTSQPSSPLGPFLELHRDTDARHDALGGFSSEYSLDPIEQQQHMDVDTTNSSPFHSTRALPPISHPHPHPHPHPHQHAGGARRISTGSVNISLGTLHQSTSEQDLRKRAAVASAHAHGAHSGCGGSGGGSALGGSGGTALQHSPVGVDLAYDHSRRTSDTFCFETLRKVVEQVGILHTDVAARDGLLRPRTRAISDSSASPRVISPGNDFEVGGMKEALKQAFETQESPEALGSERGGNGGVSLW